MSTATLADEIARVVRGEHRDPHRVLGPHAEGNQIVVRLFRPDASSVTVLFRPGSTLVFVTLAEASTRMPVIPFGSLMS